MTDAFGKLVEPAKKALAAIAAAPAEQREQLRELLNA
jgi:hypothetical protein